MILIIKQFILFALFTSESLPFNFFVVMVYRILVNEIGRSGTYSCYFLLSELSNDMKGLQFIERLEWHYERCHW